MSKLIISILLLLSISIISCNNKSTSTISKTIHNVYRDIPFDQEFHEGFKISENKLENDVRDIGVDKLNTVWIATADGVFKKEENSKNWFLVIKGEKKGPSYAIEIDNSGTVWIGTWDGVYKFENEKLSKVEGLKAPISVLANSDEGIYALGPNGIWLENNNKWEGIDYQIARSVRDAKTDGKGGLWVATNVGLYHCNNEKITLFQDDNELISCYLKGLDFDPNGDLWLGGMGGITIHNGLEKLRTLTPEEGIPSVNINSVTRAPDGTMWIGSEVGVVRYYSDGSHSLRLGKRWLEDNRVREVAFDSEGTAWIATANGVSAIKNKKMTLLSKEKYFYSILMERHIRDPWIAHVTKLDTPGDISSSKDVDDDNDGQYTSMYLAMEAMRYTVTKDIDAKIKARKALDFLMKLQTITETEGFFARTIVPIEWDYVNDGNRKYNQKQLAEALINEVRFKPVEKRWHKSKDGKWLWKGDTSSDEMCGHMAAYYFYYEYVADEEEKVLVKDHVKKIMDHLIENDFYLIDIDGKHTFWGVWSPDKLNRDPDWAPDRGINSLELLSYLKLVYHMTKDEKYQEIYLNLINKEGYLENAKRIITSNPAWNTYIDPELLYLTFPPLFKYEEDPQLKKIYNEIIDTWYQKFRKDESPFFNFMYTYLRGKTYDLDKSIFFLQDTPLDLVDWNMDQALREDIIPKRYPVLEVLQTNVLLPPSERETVRWDKNPWQLSGGNPYMEREPVFWLLPYWLGKYIGAIE
jgi:streptogramin lyase